MKQTKSGNGNVNIRNGKNDEYLRRRLQTLFQMQSRDGPANVTQKSEEATKESKKGKAPQRKITVKLNPSEQGHQTNRGPKQPNIPTKKNRKGSKINQSQSKTVGAAKQPNIPTQISRKKTKHAGSYKINGTSQKHEKLRKPLNNSVKPPMQTTHEMDKKRSKNRLKRDFQGKANNDHTSSETEMKRSSKKRKVEIATHRRDEYDSNSSSGVSKENVDLYSYHSSNSDSSYSESEFSFSSFSDEDDYYDIMNNFSNGYESNSEDEANSSDEEEEDLNFDEDKFRYFGSSSDDEDYHLPPHVAEDLIIHEGTATKRDLAASDCIQFSEDCTDSQVIEIEDQLSVKVIEQPQEYQRATLEELNKKEIASQLLHSIEKVGVDSENNTDCPQLVPITGDSNSSENCSVEECSDQDGSIMSVDVNSKYYPHSDEEDDTSTVDENGAPHKRCSRMYAEVIDVTNKKCTNKKQKSFFCFDEKDDTSLPDLLQSEIRRPLANNDCAKCTIIVAKVNSDDGSAQKSPEVSNVILNTDGRLGVANKAHVLEVCPKESFPTSQTDNSKQRNSTTVQSNRNIFCNSLDSNKVLVLLIDPIYMYGTVTLIPIVGTVEVYGYTPRLGEELELFSPRGLCSVCIAAKLKKQTTNQALSKEMQTIEKNFSKDDIAKVRKNFCPEGALILLQRNDQRKNLINTFKKYMNENIFPNMKTLQVERPRYSSECLLRCVINEVDDSGKAFILNPQWNQLNLQPHSKLLTIGGKSVGKSTMLRYLVNRHLSQQSSLLFIDLDIGQPELFVPQTISATVVKQPLLGPGFFQNQQPVKAFAIGHSNVVLCPRRYMLAVKELFEFLISSAEYAQMPWLVNTMGYNKGFGAELISVICELMQPTDVVQLQSNKDINNFDNLMEPLFVAGISRNIYDDEIYRKHNVNVGEKVLAYKLHVFKSAVMQESRYQRDWEMSAKDLRYSIMLARLSEALDSNSDWLTDSRPLCASLDDLKIISLLSGDYTQEQLLMSIEANLVYLCRFYNENIVECFGIGVVRAIDYHVKQVYLLPAFPRTRMTEINCIAIGEMPLPTSMLTNQGPKVKNIAPYLYNTVEDNSTKSIKQIYYRPAEFLSGKHKNFV